MAKKLDEELKQLLVYYGEDSSVTKPEEFFGLIVSFASSLAVRFIISVFSCLNVLLMSDHPLCFSRKQEKRMKRHAKKQREKKKGKIH